MKRMIVVAVLLGVLGITVGPDFAGVDPPKVSPKEQEGPGIRAKVPSKGLEGPSFRDDTEHPPLCVEGPDIR